MRRRAARAHVDIVKCGHFGPTYIPAIGVAYDISPAQADASELRRHSPFMQASIMYTLNQSTFQSPILIHISSLPSTD
jgi:hypothetical protein